MAKRADSGFTLIELLVVIIILGIISAVVIFAVRGVGDRGKSASYATDAKTIRTAQEAFCGKFGQYGTEEQLTGQAPAPDGKTYKFLSEPSSYHDITLSNTGPCKGAGGVNSAFGLTCNVDQVGCGTAGATPAGGTLVINNGPTVPSTFLNPAVNSAGGIHSNSEDMFNGLLRYEADGSLGGDLAQTFNFDNNVPSGANPNCPPATPSVTCDSTTTVATFVLRPNVKFHGKDSTRPGDGEILSPADVEFSFEKAILANHGRTKAINPTLGVTGSQNATVVPANAITTLPPNPAGCGAAPAPACTDGGTVIFNLRQIFTPLKYTLNVTEAPILSKTAYEPCYANNSLFSGSNCPANLSPVGTGPFRFKSLDTTGIRTVKNPDYFRPGLPKFDEIYKKVVNGSSAGSLINGAVDVASIPNNERPLVQNDSRIVLTSTPRGSGGANCITTIAFNTTKRQAGSATTAPAPPGGATKIGAPTSDGGYPADSPYYGQNKTSSNENAPPHQILGDARVREAIFKSIDRNKIWTDIAFSAGRVADAPVHSIFQPDGAYQGPQPLPTFDRTAAGALLDQAGWSTIKADGFRYADANHPNVGNSDPQLAVVPGTTKLALEYLAALGNEAYGQEVKSQLKNVGIDVTPVFGDNTDVVAPRTFRARTFDMTQISYCNNDEPQFGVRRQYHTDSLIQTTSFTNASGYKSTLMDSLWVDASKASDVSTYQAKYLQIQRMALGLSTTGGPALTALETNQRVPMVQLLESAGTRGYLAACSGFNNNNTGLYMEAASCTQRR